MTKPSEPQYTVGEQPSSSPSLMPPEVLAMALDERRRAANFESLNASAAKFAEWIGLMLSSDAALAVEASQDTSFNKLFRDACHCIEAHGYEVAQPAIRSFIER